MIENDLGCNICGNKESRNVFAISRYDKLFRIKKCTKCGLVYLGSRPNHEELREYYSQVYDYDGFLARAESIKDRARLDLDFIQRYREAGNLLEVGCMYGFLVDLARKRGFNSCGVEISGKAVEWAKENLKIDVQNCSLEEAVLEDNFFDVVYLSHLIEHLEDPRASLKIMRKIMKDDGVLIMKCPNFGSLMSRLTRSKWWWIAPPEHLYHFTPKTMRTLLRSIGFSRIEISTNRGDLGYLRYFTVGFVNLLPIPRSWKVNYRATIDSHPEHMSQRILLSAYNLARPIVALIHKINMGEEMVVVAKQ